MGLVDLTGLFHPKNFYDFFSFPRHLCAGNINPVTAFHPSEGNNSSTVAWGIQLEIIILNLIKVGFCFTSEPPTLLLIVLAGQCESKGKQNQGGEGVQPPARIGEQGVKSRNGCEGLSWFGLGTMQVVTDQLPEFGGSGVV